MIVAAIAALLLVVSMASVGATPPTDVQFGEESIFDLGGGGPFTSVEGSGICKGGDQVDLFAKIVGFQSGTGKANVQVLKEFTCDDGSGTFLVKLQIREDPRKLEGGNLFNWTILGGTGDYEKLHGSGQGVGMYGECRVGDEDIFCIRNSYTGKIHND